MTGTWYTIKAQSADVLNVSIHDEIGLWGISAAQFMSELSAAPDARTINLSIHSPGGSILDGFAMYNALAAHSARVLARVEGIAASAASMVLMAGDVVSMPEDSFLMIHNAWGVAIGDAEDMRDMADIIDKLQNTATNIYARKTGMDTDALREMMAAETWMSADDAVSLGFADTVTSPIKAAASMARFSRYFSAMPTTDSGVDDVASITDANSFEKFLREAGVSRRLAPALTSRARELWTAETAPTETGNELAQVSARLRQVAMPESLSARRTNHYGVIRS